LHVDLGFQGISRQPCLFETTQHFVNRNTGLPTRNPDGFAASVAVIDAKLLKDAGGVWDFRDKLTDGPGGVTIHLFPSKLLLARL
jgi:hypothetical protein